MVYYGGSTTIFELEDDDAGGTDLTPTGAGCRPSIASR